MKTPFSLLLGACLMLPLSFTQAADTGAARPDVWLTANACAGCHGTFGHSVGAAPSIAGLPEDVFVRAMQEYQSGARPSTVMDRIAKGYTAEDFAAMAKFFAKQLSGD